MNKNFREFNKRATRLAGIKESRRPMRRRRRLNENKVSFEELPDIVKQDLDFLDIIENDVIECKTMAVGLYAVRIMNSVVSLKNLKSLKTLRGVEIAIKPVGALWLVFKP